MLYYAILFIPAFFVSSKLFQFIGIWKDPPSVLLAIVLVYPLHLLICKLFPPR